MEAKNVKHHVWSLTQENQAGGTTGMEEEFNVCIRVTSRLHIPAISKESKIATHAIVCVCFYSACLHVTMLKNLLLLPCQQTT